LAAQIKRDLKDQADEMATTLVDPAEFLHVCIGLARDSRVNYDTPTAGQDTGPEARAALEAIFKALKGDKRGTPVDRELEQVNAELRGQPPYGPPNYRQDLANEEIAYLRCLQRVHRQIHRRRKQGRSSGDTSSGVAVHEMWRQRVAGRYPYLNGADLERETMRQLVFLQRQVALTDDPRKIRNRYGLTARGRERLATKIAEGRHAIRQAKRTN
jgi:hypothetical protein